MKLEAINIEGQLFQHIGALPKVPDDNPYLVAGSINGRVPSGVDRATYDMYQYGNPSSPWTTYMPWGSWEGTYTGFPSLPGP